MVEVLNFKNIFQFVTNFTVYNRNFCSFKIGID